MTARDGMASLITRLRGMCAADIDEYTVVNVTYWSDDQLQDALDDQRCDRLREPLTVQPETVSGGSVVYHDYYFQRANVEEATSGSTAWRLEDSTGADISTASYSVNYRAQQIRFTADTRGTAYSLTYREFDLERAAAEVWEQKAGHAFDRYDLKTDNHDMKRSQLYDHCLKQAELHRRRAPAHVGRLQRGDVNWGGGWT